MGDNANTTEKAAAPKKSFFKGLKSEFKKIVWPDKNTLLKQSVAVVIVSVLLGVLIALMDTVIQLGVDKIFQIG